MYILTKYKQECIYTESWNDVIEAIADEGLEGNCQVLQMMLSGKWFDNTGPAVDEARNWDDNCREERNQDVMPVVL